MTEICNSSAGHRKEWGPTFNVTNLHTIDACMAVKVVHEDKSIKRDDPCYLDPALKKEEADNTHSMLE